MNSLPRPHLRCDHRFCRLVYFCYSSWPIVIKYAGFSSISLVVVSLCFDRLVVGLYLSRNHTFDFGGGGEEMNY
ncbi:hypothetical protein ACHAXS_004401 [Conticribra weissflogii]